ncbi:unnamed protein product [Neospora caninum Liverpool]|uniref:AP2 domain transcription factor AP2IX-5 n=1 Tax=Neospora caninum (strain Liverpool) TaxID=572307 RepID=F0VBY7_NEOCL|nr:uncharacterized protein NCLIV_041960 [Neospora caninum Liverpool]CBZ51121.1 unnamed protein product [Neospora caninum Liverpool]CEL68429.1 TPA: AP2 domain transcription factor AP2IX-5 [Neospora caninum Liverpool]|eukprot:XP_003881154.1 uncharacterized protein NCLIV_041960 [Neospora caninum Liverpool]
MVWPPTPTSTSSSTQTPLASLLPLQFFPSSPGCSPTSRQFDVCSQASLGFGISGGGSSPSRSGAQRSVASHAPRGLSLPSSSGVVAAGVGSSAVSTPASPRFFPFTQTASPSAALLSKVLVGSGSPTRAGGRVTPSTPLHLTASPTGDPFALFATTSTSSDSAEAGGPFSSATGNGEASGTVTPTLLLPLSRRSYQPALLFGTSVSASTLSPRVGERRTAMEKGESCADSTPVGGAVGASLSQCALDFSPRLLNTPRSGRGLSRSYTVDVGPAASLLAGGSSHPALLVQQQNALHALAKGEATLLPNAASSGSAGHAGAKEPAESDAGATTPAETTPPEPFPSENDNCLQKAGIASPRFHGLGETGAVGTDSAGHLPLPTALTRTLSGARSVSSPASRQTPATSRAMDSRTPSGASLRRVPPSLLDPSFLFHPAQGMGGSGFRTAYLFDDASAFAAGGNGSGCASLGTGAAGPGGNGLGATSDSTGGPSASFDSFGGSPFPPPCFSPPSVFGVVTANAPFYWPSGSSFPTSASAATAASAQRLLYQTVGGASPASPLHLPLLSQRQQLLLQSSRQRRNSFPSPTSGGGRGPATPTGTDPVFGVFSVSTVSQRESGDTPRAGRASADCGSDPREISGADRTLPLVQTPRSSLPPFPSLLEVDVASGLSQAGLDAGKEERGNTVSGDPAFCSQMFLPQTMGPQTTSPRQSPSAAQPVPSLLLSACRPSQGDGDGGFPPFSGGLAAAQVSGGNAAKERETTTLLEGQPAVREAMLKQEPSQVGLGHSGPTQNAASSFLPSFLHTPSFPSFPGWRDGNNLASLRAGAVGGPGDDARRPEALPAVAADPDGPKPPAPSSAASAAGEKAPEADSVSQGSGEGVLSGRQDQAGSAQGGLFSGRTGDMLAEPSLENEGNANRYGVATSPLGTPSGTPSSLWLFGQDAGEEKQSPSSCASSEDRGLRAASQACKNKLSPRPHAAPHPSASQPAAAGGQPMSPTKGETEGSPSATKASGGKSGAGFLAAFEDAAFQQPSEEFIAYCVQKHQARWPTPQNLPGIQMEQQQRRWCASVYYRGCQHKRRFSMGRWGPLGAFYAAIEWRQSHCSRLNSLKESRSPDNPEAGGNSASGQKKRRRRSSAGSYTSRTGPPSAAERVSGGAGAGVSVPPDSASGCPFSVTGSDGMEGTSAKSGSGGGAPGTAAAKEERGDPAGETSGASADATGMYPPTQHSSFVKTQEDREQPGFYGGGSGGGEKSGTVEACGPTRPSSFKASEEDEKQAGGAPDAPAEETKRRFGDENARDSQPFTGRLEAADGSGAAACDRNAYPFFGSFQATPGDKADENAVSGIEGGKEALGDAERKRRRENDFDKSRGPLLAAGNALPADGAASGCFSQNPAPGFGSSLREEDRLDGNASVYSSHSTSGTCPSFNSPQVLHSQSLSQGTGPGSGSPSLPPAFLSWNEERASGGKDVASASLCAFNGSFLQAGPDLHFHDPRELGAKDMPGGSLSSTHLAPPTNHTFNPAAVSPPYGNAGGSAAVAGFPGPLSSSPCRQGAGLVSGGGVGVYGQPENATPAGGALAPVGMGFMPSSQNAPFDMHLHSLPPSQMYHVAHLGPGGLGSGIGQSGIRPPGVPGAAGVPSLSSPLPPFPGGVPHSGHQFSMGQPPRPLPAAHLYGSGWMQGPGHAMNPVSPGFMLGSSAPNQSSPSTSRFPSAPPTVSPSLSAASSDAHALAPSPFGTPVPTGAAGPPQSSRAKGGRKEGAGAGLACSGTPDLKKSGSASRDKQGGSTGPSRSRRAKGQNSTASALAGGLFPVAPYSPLDPAASASSFSNAHRPNLPSSFSPSFGPSSASQLPAGSPEGAGAPAVEWHEGFRRPFGTEGRQQLLRHLRQVYNADSGYWGERLRHANIAFSRIAYATVAELWKIAHVMDCFPIALAFSNRHSATASVPSEDGAMGTAGASLPGTGAAGAGRRACGAKGERAEKGKGARRTTIGAGSHGRGQPVKQGSSPAPHANALTPCSNTMAAPGSQPEGGRGDLATGREQASLPLSEAALTEGGSPNPSFCLLPESSGAGSGKGAGVAGPAGPAGRRSWDQMVDPLSSGSLPHANVFERSLTGASNASPQTSVGCNQQGPTEHALASQEVGGAPAIPLMPAGEETGKAGLSGDQASPLRLDTSHEGSGLPEGQAAKAVGDGWGPAGLQALAGQGQLAPPGLGDKAMPARQLRERQGLQTDTGTDGCSSLGVGDENGGEYPVETARSEEGAECSAGTLVPGRPRGSGAGGKRKEEGPRQPSLSTSPSQSFGFNGTEDGDFEDAPGDQRPLSLSRVRPGKKKREAKEKKVKEDGNPVATKRKEDAREEVLRDGVDTAEPASLKAAPENAFASEGVQQTLPMPL